MPYAPSYYIPLDRRHAMAGRISLPERTEGSALFADISGFTAITEALGKELGHQRGAEELTKHLNLIFEGLIDDLERFHGSVIGFSGDAITCWIDGDDGLHALACAFAMQKTISKFATLRSPAGVTFPIAMKVAVATGPVRRFKVGNPQVQYWDVLAGQTIQELAEGEHQAGRGEVVVTAGIARRHSDSLALKEWRAEGQYAVVEKLTVHVAENPWPPLDSYSFTEEQVRPWILPGTFDRVSSSHGFFESELRPAVALFLRFGGLDYDHDEAAGEKLDRFIQWAQSILERFDGRMIQLTFGDKGSYLSAAFGAPVAHENDVTRALLAGLQLRVLPPGLEYISGVQIGISKGRMLVGPYGSSTMRTYGILGDQTNLAARLMQNAAEGEVLVSQEAQREAADEFLWEYCVPFMVKGKSEPITVFRLKAFSPRRSGHLQEPRYALPMVGRRAELELIEEKISEGLAERGQILAVTSEAGLGKSRLAAEVIRLAVERGMEVHAGECQSYGVNIAYLVWRSIWQSLIGLNHEAPLPEQLEQLESRLAEIDPGLVQRMPLLGILLNMAIPDNAFTQMMDGRLRKESLEALLVDCLRSKAKDAPLLLVLENCQWLDPLSHDLLEVVGRSIQDLAVTILVAYRPPDIKRLTSPRISSLPNSTIITLNELSPEEALQLITLKLEQVLKDKADISPVFQLRLMERAQGNPFYIEELINYLHDRQIDLQDGSALEQLELPVSVQSLILSRIDQLMENQKILLKVASIIGRLFPVSWLPGVDPGVGDASQIKTELDNLNRLDLTELDQPEPEEVYLFKHFVTRDVAYESLPYATRALLHANLGGFIERAYIGILEQYIDLLAYHYDLSEHQAKRKEYLYKAGIAAQAAYANETAIDYYRRLLPLLPEEERAGVYHRLGQVYELVGEWPEAEESYRQGLELADEQEQLDLRVANLNSLGILHRKQGSYPEAEAWLQQAREGFLQLGDGAGVCQALAEIGEVYRLKGSYSEAEALYQASLRLADEVPEPAARLTARASVLKSAGTLANQQGNPEKARLLYEESLAIRRELGDRYGVAVLLNNLGMVAMFQDDFARAEPLFRESLEIFREIGDRWAIGQLLNNLGLVLRYRLDSAGARRLLQESVEVRRALGDKWGIANSLSSLSNLLIHLGELDGVREMIRESLRTNLELGDKIAAAYCLEDFASLAAGLYDPQRALRLAGAAAALREELGGPLPAVEQAALDLTLLLARQMLDEDEQAQAWNAGRAMSFDEAVEYALG